MDRFHLVVANYNKIHLFISNIRKIKHLSQKFDKIFIFDCSSSSKQSKEVKEVRKLEESGFFLGKNVFFIARRNWNVNHGAQLDYLREVISTRISPAQYIFFLQDHFLDTKHFVKEDTIPNHLILDLNDIEKLFIKMKDLGCIFASRNGIRISVNNYTDKEWGDEKTFKALKDKKICIKDERNFFVDGGNFIIRSKYFIDWFKNKQELLIKGDGSYGFAHVWESRFGWILYNQGIRWYDLVYKISYRSINELVKIEEVRKRKFSKVWFDNRLWYWFYGKDFRCRYHIPLLEKILFILISSFFRYLLYNRNINLKYKYNYE